MWAVLSKRAAGILFLGFFMAWVGISGGCHEGDGPGDEQDALGPTDSAQDLIGGPDGFEGFSAYPCFPLVNELNYAADGVEATTFVELRFHGDWQGRTLHECGITQVSFWTTDGTDCNQYQDTVLLEDAPIPASGLWVLGSLQLSVAPDQEMNLVDWKPVVGTGLLVLSNAQDQALAVNAYGNCANALICEDVQSAVFFCMPPDDGGGNIGVSICEEEPVPGRPVTPGSQNDCPCPIDCQASAPLCQVGACVDGTCVYELAPEGSVCHDGNPCTTGDGCYSGTCFGESIVCPAPNGCVGMGVCDSVTGACVYEPDCPHHASCDEATKNCICDVGFHWVDNFCVDTDECATLKDECAPEAECINVEGGYVCVCPPDTFGDGFDCEPICQDTCDWMPGECGGQSAVVEVVALDLWAQPLVNASVELYAPEGGDVPVSGSSVLQGSLCGPALLWLDVYADGYHPTFLDLHYDGAGSPDGLYVEEWSVGQPTSWMITEDVRWIDGMPVQHYTVWLGLTHRYFASTGLPARRGNLVDLLVSPEEAWATVWSDLQFAEELVTTQTWWWESDFELVREEGIHPFMNAAQRWPFTVISTLEELTWSGVEVKTMVNQFISEEGLLTGITVDDPLFEKAENPGDGFEFLGIANPSYGMFDVEPIPWSFESWVLYAYPEVSWVDATYLAEPAAPFGVVEVDLTDIPLGLGSLELPIASWHQKTTTIDQDIAFIGGINTKGTDWDGSSHHMYDARRMPFDASTDERVDVLLKHDKPEFEPRKDYMLRIEGPIVADAMEVFQKEWLYQIDQGVPYSELASGFQLEPPDAPISGGVQAQVVTTMPAPFTELSILETLVNAISQAQTYIYIEDQYFRAPIVVETLVEQMASVPDLQLMVITNEVSEWTDPGCWHTHLAYEALNSQFSERFHVFTMKTFEAVDTECWLCIDETAGYFDRVFIHSKMVIIDDVYLLTGSANQNNRSMLYEAEISVAIYDEEWVTAARHQVMSLLLGSSYSSWLQPSELWEWFVYAADYNQWVYDNWDDEGFDLDLDGDPLGDEYKTDGFLYPLNYGTPGDCFIENVGEDIM